MIRYEILLKFIFLIKFNKEHHTNIPMSNRDRHDDLINRYNRLGDYSAARSYRDSPMSPSAYRSTGYKD